MKKGIAAVVALLLAGMLLCGAVADGLDLTPYLGLWYFDGFELEITEKGEANLIQNGQTIATDAVGVTGTGFTVGDTPIAIDENGDLVCGSGTGTLIGSRFSQEELLAQFDLTPYLGSWYMGDYRIEILESGRAAQYIGGEPDADFPLSVKNGVLTIDGMPCVLDENGNLVCGSGEYTVVATREK